MNEPFRKTLANNGVAQKYKEYSRTRDVLSGKIPSQAPSSPQRHARKRKHEAAPIQTPSKRLQAAQTPSKTPSHPALIDPYDSPSVIRNLFTPSRNKPIGPTPQKDGQALGIFDLIDDESSPEKALQNARAQDRKIHATPTKSRAQLDFMPTTGKRSRTPASSGKRFMLDSFATPLKRRHPNEQGDRTPSSVSKLHFSTPSFLRRDSHRISMPAIEETEDGPPLSPQMIRLPRKPLVRGLSSMLAGLREMEEKHLDDELDALREMEMDTVAGPTKPKPQPVTSQGKGDTVEVEDSQVPQAPILLGGFDDEAMFDSEPEDAINPSGQPLRVYKKRGQKRTTRATKMKPNRSKPSLPAPHAAPPDLSDDLLNTEDVVGETQPRDFDRATGDDDDNALGGADARNFASDTSGTEYTASEGGTRYPRPDQEKGKKKGGVVDGVRRVARKVGTTAHMNFKRLKLRNSGAKGGPGVGSRFRRRK
jgi:DNA replication regulator SLD2